jgi:glycosyltransferase involved in cell wall biosynthesis
LAARSKTGLPADLTLVGIVATLRSWKGHRYLVEACAALPQNVGLVIVGDGPQREALQALVASHSLNDRVWMPGNQDDVVPWLQSLDIFTLPSYANEGVPQALIQAMLVALPVVTTSAGSIGELALDGKTALVVPSQDVQALHKSIALLISDAGLRSRLGQAARNYCIGRYSLERMLDSMEAVFGSVIPGTPPVAPGVA